MNKKFDAICTQLNTVRIIRAHEKTIHRCNGGTICNMKTVYYSIVPHNIKLVDESN